MKITIRLFILALIVGIFTTTFALPESSFSTGYAAPENNPAELKIALDFSKDKISGGEQTTGKIRVERSGNKQELVIRLENSNPGLARLAVTEVRLKPGETTATFVVGTAATPIKTAVTIKAVLQPAGQVQVEKVIQIVPAMLKGVTLSQPTLNGTHGSKINCRVVLNAPAPMGGIGLYLNLTPAISKVALSIPNPRVQAGQREVTFEIDYNKISFLGEKIDGKTRTASEFNSQTRNVELVVSLEPQTTIWQAIPGVAGMVTFDIIPLRVASISVQPTSVQGGAEALATFTLNFPPGPGEKVRLKPDAGGSSTSTTKAWARALGSSCQPLPSGTILEMPLTQGVATYSFKVCTAPVTTSTISTLSVITQSPTSGNTFPVQITVHP